jgi:hypothetical protein
MPVADFINCGCLPYAKADDVDNVTLMLNGGHTSGSPSVGRGLRAGRRWRRP